MGSDPGADVRNKVKSSIDMLGVLKYSTMIG